MTTITTISDVRVWIGNSRPDVTGDDVNRLVEAIQDADHPAYGTDWEAFLTAFDYVGALEER